MPNTALQSPFASVSRPQVLLVEDDESLMAPLVALLCATIAQIMKIGIGLLL